MVLHFKGFGGGVLGDTDSLIFRDDPRLPALEKVESIA